jgi:hypothetical protein
MRRRYLSLIIIFIAVHALAADDPISKLATIIRQGNMHELSALMAGNVEISLPGDDNSYSKQQAEAVLSNFFSHNKPLSVKVFHEINSNPHYRFGVLLMNTGRGIYRIAITLKQVNGALQLIELRIETEKVR